MNILELIQIFKDKINKRNAKRKQTEIYLNMIREYILTEKKPHIPVKAMYLSLKKTKGIVFTYQYFVKLVDSNWNVIVNEDDGKSYLIVSSETNKICEW